MSSSRMSVYKNAATIALLTLELTGCFHPPFNNFEKRSPDLKPLAVQASVGTITGIATGGTAAAAIIGASIGTGSAAGWSVYKNSEKVIIKQLKEQNIQFIRYGETRLLIVPTDHYFMVNSPRLNEICYEGLNNIIRLLRNYPCSTIYVAAFTDNVGSRVHKRRLSQAQAETMLGFLWANGIPAASMRSEGYGDKHSIGDNSIIHGSAFNRRIEIEWVPAKHGSSILSGTMK